MVSAPATVQRTALRRAEPSTLTVKESASPNAKVYILGRTYDVARDAFTLLGWIAHRGSYFNLCGSLLYCQGRTLDDLSHK